MNSEKLLRAMRELNVRLDFMLEKKLKVTNSDPNVLEMNDTMYDVANLLHKDYINNRSISELGKSIECKFNLYMINSVPKLVSKEVGLYATELAGYFTDKLDEMHGYNYIGDETMKKTMNVVSNANYIVQSRIRNIKKYANNSNDIIYTDSDDYRKIGLLCEITDLSGSSQRLVDEVDDAYMADLYRYNNARASRKSKEKVRRP